MSQAPHSTHVFNTLEQLLEHMGYYDDTYAMSTGDKAKMLRLWTKIWKRHIEKRGNVPFIVKCAICSGEELKTDIKLGKYRVARPGKVERDEFDWKKKSE